MLVQRVGIECEAFLIGGGIAADDIIPQAVKLLWMHHWQGTEHHRVDQSEDSRIRSNAEREGQNSNKSKPRAAIELPQPIPRVLEQILQPAPSRHFPPPSTSRTKFRLVNPKLP